MTQSMTQHAELPSLCPTCLAHAHALVEGNPRDRHVLMKCKHRGVLAVGFQRDGRVQSWHLEGPAPEDELLAAAERIIMQLAAANMRISTITQQ